MVTGWSYFAGSRGVPDSCISWTRAFPREVTRSEIWTGLSEDISGCGGLTVTGPSQVPARVLSWSNDFWASVSARAAVVSSSRAAKNRQRKDFIFGLLGSASLAANYSVVVNYNTRFKSRPIFPQPIKSFFLMDILVAAVRLLALLRSRHWLLEFASRSSDLHED